MACIQGTERNTHAWSASHKLVQGSGANDLLAQRDLHPRYEGYKYLSETVNNWIQFG